MSPCGVLCAVCAVLLAVAGRGGALECWRCGQYSDGVGSITPCTNSSGAELLACLPQHSRCIKYVSELTTVRDCAPSCVEKEWWGARTYCCDTDGCNSAPSLMTCVATCTLTTLLVVARG